MARRTISAYYKCRPSIGQWSVHSTAGSGICTAVAALVWVEVEGCLLVVTCPVDPGPLCMFCSRAMGKCGLASFSLVVGIDRGKRTCESMLHPHHFSAAVNLFNRYAVFQ